MADTSTAPRRGNGEGTKPIQRKDGRWQTSIRFVDANGKATRRTFTGPTAKAAREKMNEARRRIETGQFAVDSSDTVAHLVAAWIAGPLLARELKFNTERDYAQVARDYIADSSVGRTPVGKLTPSQIERWLLTELDARGVSKTRRRLILGVLKMILDVALRDGLIQSNPTRLVHRPSHHRKQIEILTVPQLDALVDQLKVGTARTTNHLTHRVGALVLIHTGMRRGEMLGLQWSDIDFDAATIRIDKTLSRVPGQGLMTTSVKTLRSNRTLHMVPELAAELRAHRARQNEARLAHPNWKQTGYVFTTTHGGPVDGTIFYDALTKAATRAGIPNFRVHTLRHTAISLMLMAGVPLKTVSEIAGHASITITADIYGHITDKVVTDALSTLSDVLRRAAS